MLLTALPVPLGGALLVAATCVVSSRVSRRIGMASALVAAFSPVFLYELVQPMSDVPAGALWMLAVALVTSAHRRGAALGGLAAGAALLVRPHLAPLALPLGLFLLFRPQRPWRHRLRAAVAFAACAVPGVVGVAAIRFSLYGFPLGAGHSSLGLLFSLDRVAPNAVRYASWLTETQTPAWMLAGAAPFLLPGALTGLFLGLVLVNAACYLPYLLVDDWSSLRFLLPTIPLLMILALACLDSICRRLAPWTARPVVALAAVALVVLYVREAQVRHVFQL